MTGVIFEAGHHALSFGDAPHALNSPSRSSQIERRGCSLSGKWVPQVPASVWRRGAPSVNTGQARGPLLSQTPQTSAGLFAPEAKLSPLNSLAESLLRVTRWVTGSAWGYLEPLGPFPGHTCLHRFTGSSMKNRPIQWLTFFLSQAAGFGPLVNQDGGLHNEGKFCLRRYRIQRISMKKKNFLFETGTGYVAQAHLEFAVYLRVDSNS